jgi:hypothetical protein
MKPYIDTTHFGSISVDGKIYEHDIYINIQGEVIKRKKKLSKEIYGSSHTVSIKEAEFLYEKGAEQIIIGTGQYGVLKLSAEAEEFFSENNCKVSLFPTPEALKRWNLTQTQKSIALIHVTC